MQSAYTAVCLLCGREVGHVVDGRVMRGARRPRLVRDGRSLRCGHCRGSVVLQPDPDLAPRDWVAEAAREGGLGPGRRARRTA